MPRHGSCAFVFVLFATLLLAAAPSFAASARKITQLAEGVYEIEHSTGTNVSGNTTVIIGTRQVLVVDTGFLPSDAKEDIGQIRRWTNKPVSFVVNTHFHNDHNFGNRAYMDAFPGLTVIAHSETKREMDLFGPGSLSREQATLTRYQRALDTGKTEDGQTLSADDRKLVEGAVAKHLQTVNDMKGFEFQSATLTFDQGLTIDLGGREVQVKFLGRGNTGGDAVVYLPKEKIVVAGDLLVYPMPYAYDGYPREWVVTLQTLAQLDADTIVPGHGPVMHDKSYLFLVRDLYQSAIDQLDAKLRRTRPAMFLTIDQVKDDVDLSAFRQRFTHGDRALDSKFDETAALLTKLVLDEARLH